jgi:hypothetical protein
MLWKHEVNSVRPKAIRVTLTLSGGVLLSMGIWLLLHLIPGALPAAADASRFVLGDRAVTSLEESVYSVTDGVKRRVYQDRAPRAHWRAKASPAIAPLPSASSKRGPELLPPEPRFTLSDVGPMYPAQAAEGDGVWLPAEPGTEPSASCSSGSAIARRQRRWRGACSMQGRTPWLNST